MNQDRPPNIRHLHPLAELTKARMREFFREKGLVFWVFVFPLLMAIGLGLAFRERPPEVPKVAVVAQSTGSLLEALLASPRIDAQHVSLATAKRGLARARFDVAVQLPADGVPVFLADPMQSRSPYASLLAQNVVQVALGRKDSVQIIEQELVQPGARYIDFLLPGLIGMNLMGSSMWGVGYSLVVARKRKLLRRYAVTPMKRLHFLLSYFVSRLTFLVLEVGVLLLFGALVFGATTQGSYFALALSCVAGASAFAAISLLIGARAENTETANGWMNFVQLPMWVLSGVFFSYERFPEWLQPAISALPLTAAVNALRAVFNDGASLTAIVGQLAILLGWTVVGTLVARQTFRWQ